MATPDDLSKLETLYRGQIYNDVATYSSFDPSKLETLYRGQLFYGVGPAEVPAEPAPDTTRMFLIF
jgi:hypothetical protein